MATANKRMETALEVSASRCVPTDLKLSGGLQKNRQSRLGALLDGLRDLLFSNPQIQIQMKTLVGLLAISVCMQMSAQVMVNSEPQKSDIVFSLQDSGYSPEIFEITALPQIDQAFIVEDSHPAVAVVESTAIDVPSRPFVVINGDTFYLDGPALNDGINYQYQVEPTEYVFVDRLPSIKPPQASEARSINTLKQPPHTYRPVESVPQSTPRDLAPEEPDWPAVALVSVSTVIWALTPAFKA